MESILEGKIQELKIRDFFFAVKRVSEVIRNIFHSAAVKLIRIFECIRFDIESENWVAKGAALLNTEGGQMDINGEKSYHYKASIERKRKKLSRSVKEVSGN